MEINVNKQNNSQMAGAPTNRAQSQPASSGSKTPWIILVIVVVIAIVALVWAFHGKFTSSKAKNLSGYQAVFLTNGQVYFGKLSHVNQNYVRLTDIYYLQVNQQLQPTGTANQQAQAQQQQPQLSLVKLGNELHGPTDQMEINRSQVLFFEDLKSDGKVAQAIASYKAGQSNGTPATAAPTSSTPAAGSTPAANGI